MAFAKNTMRLGTAQRVFSSFDIQAIMIGDSAAGYTAQYRGKELQDISLTSLCETLICNLEKDAGI